MFSSSLATYTIFTCPACGCRLSGAFAITRRQSMGGPGIGLSADGGADLSPLHASPFHLGSILREDGDEAGVDGTGEEQQICNLEMQDEEFVAQEQAHT